MDILNAMFDVEYGLSTYCAPNFIQNTTILITLGRTSVENIGLECTIAYNNQRDRK